MGTGHHGAVWEEWGLFAALRVDAGSPSHKGCSMSFSLAGMLSSWGLGCELGSLQFPTVSLLCPFPAHSPVSPLLFPPPSFNVPGTSGRMFPLSLPVLITLILCLN